MRNCVAQQKEDKTVVTPHCRGNRFNLQLEESLYKIGVVRDPFPAMENVKRPCGQLGESST